MVLAASLFLGAVAVGMAADAGEMAVGAGESDAPQAEAGLDQTVYQNQTVYLDAGGSVAPDGEIASYEWEIETPTGETTEPACSDCVRSSFVPTEVGIYAVSVTVTDDEGRENTDTMYVTVEEYDPPSVSLDGPSTVPVGSLAAFTAEASAGTEVLSSLVWTLDGEYHGDGDIDGETAATETTDVAFAEPGLYRMNATVVDRFGYQVTDDTTVRVTTPEPYLAVLITDVSTPVEAGEQVTVEALVENVGGEEATGPTWLTRNGTVVDVYGDVSLAPGESQGVTFTWETMTGDAGTYALAAHTVDDTDSRTATVEAGAESEEAYFAVEFTTPPSETVEVSDDVEPVVEVTNTGDAEATQPVTLVDIHGVPAASTDVSLAAGESTELSELSWTPGPSETGSGTMEVQTLDDDDAADLTVRAPGVFEVEIVDTAPFGVDGAADAEVSVRVTNVGGFEDTQTVTLSTGFDVAGATPGTLDEETVTLDPDEEATLEMTWSDAAAVLTEEPDEDPVEAFTAGEEPEEPTTYTADVEAASEDDTDSASLTPEPPVLLEPGTDQFDEFIEGLGIDEVEAAIEAQITDDGELEVLLIPEAAENAPDLPEFLERQLEQEMGSLLRFLEGDEIDLTEHEVFLEGDDGVVELGEGGLQELAIDSDEGELVIEFDEVESHEDDARVRFVPGEEASDELDLASLVEDALEDGNVTEEEVRDALGADVTEDIFGGGGPQSETDSGDSDDGSEDDHSPDPDEYMRGGGSSHPGIGSDDDESHDSEDDSDEQPGADHEPGPPIGPGEIV